MGLLGGYKLACFFVIIATTYGLPRINENDLASGLGTAKITSAILKAKLNTRDNFVFAPIGYASILAILGEGAGGATQKEISDFLGLPEDRTRSRDTFRSQISLFSGDEPVIPQFKTWFYVYENNSSINEAFLKTLRDDYLVETKTVPRRFYDFDEPPATPVPASEVQVSEDAPEKVLLADPKDITVAKESETKNLPAVNDDGADNMFDEVDLEGKLLSNTADIENILKQKECSRFDEEIDDQQYVEVQTLREGTTGGAEASSQPEDNETVHPIEKLEELKKIVKIDDNAETLKQLDKEMGILAVVRKHPVTKKFQAAVLGRALEKINDVSSALSGNSLMGRKEGNGQELESKMLLFNGLYFRGKWKTPFQRLRSEANPGDLFYMQGEGAETVEVTMMRSRGEFKTAFSDKFKAQIIELPYEDERYAMVVVMPRDNGLKNLVDQLDYATMKHLSSDLKLRTLELSLPKFSVETTSTVHKEFAEMGLATLFSEAADLSGITGDQRLRVNELVQHVSVRVDEGASTENSISASDVASRSGKSEAETEEQAEGQQHAEEKEETFIVNQPFLFFVRDTINDVTLVAGIINKPLGPQLFADFVTQDRSSGAAPLP